MRAPDGTEFELFEYADHPWFMQAYTVSNGGAEYRFVQFTLVRGTKDNPQEDKDGAVFVVDKQLTKKAQARPAVLSRASVCVGTLT